MCLQGVLKNYIRKIKAFEIKGIIVDLSCLEIHESPVSLIHELEHFI